MTTVGLSRPRAVSRARFLNRLTIGWNLVEAVVALAAGIVAGSVSLVGFGLDSVVEVSAAGVLAWRLAQEARGGCSQDADRLAQRGVALSFLALSGYVGWRSVADLMGGAQPDASMVGIALAAASLVVMPILARAKRSLAPVLGSRAQQAEASQTALCAWMSGVLLAGLGLNAVLGWWWADPIAGIGIAALAGVEAVRTWRAESLADTCCG